MAKSLARDLLRVAVFIPYVSPRIEQVIDRAWWWADDVFVVTPDHRTLDAETFPIGNPRDPYNTHIVGTAWKEFEQRLMLRDKDYIAFLYPDEILVNSDALRPALRLHMGKAIGFKRYAMVDEDHYSLFFSPEITWLAIPYAQNGSFIGFNHEVRGPHYVQQLPKIAISATDVLDYQYSDRDSRAYWASFYGVPRIKNLHNMAKAEWKRGGKL